MFSDLPSVCAERSRNQCFLTSATGARYANVVGAVSDAGMTTGKDILA